MDIGGAVNHAARVVWEVSIEISQRFLMVNCFLFLLTPQFRWQAWIYCSSAEVVTTGIVLWALYHAPWRQDDLCRTFVGGLSDWLAGLGGLPFPHWLGHMELHVLWTAASATFNLSVCVNLLSETEPSLVILYWSSKWHIVLKLSSSTVHPALCTN